ncbi:MAG: polyphosphate kinase 2 family protein [Acetobacteraceae bacterium]|nr:polyphosphate kinase 2 family protein [Acetobacteraceae bacterium]MCX7685431.1 polyphosphate kinase 2 family protein [Acetobacteraceae bacterium]
MRDILARYRVEDGKGFRLSRHDPADTAGLSLGKGEAREWLAQGIADLARLQDMLYAQDRWSVLILFQAMDAAGKDSAIKHVFSGVNPQGCHVVSFKAPSAAELDHDFLWRHVLALPARGMIGIHNRSWYEEVLVVRVRREILARQKLPEAVRGPRLFRQRLADIAAFESYLARQGTLILKFFLHVSREEQRRRFLERIEDPAKNWKFHAADLAERARWDDYMAAYEAAIRATAAPHAPWFVVPADAKWFTRLVVAAAIGEALRGLGLAYPEPDAAQRAELAAARAALG